MYVSHLQSRDALAKLTQAATGALDKALSKEHILAHGVKVPAASSPGGEAGWLSLPMYETIASAVYEATVSSFYGEAFATEANYRAFRAFDKDFPLMVAGIPMLGGNKARDVLFEQLSSEMPYDSGASDFIKGRANIYREAERDAKLDKCAHNSAQTAIIWAIVANTMPASFWTLFFILRDSKALAVVTKELAAAVALSGSDGAASLAPLELDALEVLDSCITEALRLTSGSIIMRQVWPWLLLFLEHHPGTQRCSPKNWRCLHCYVFSGCKRWARFQDERKRNSSTPFRRPRCHLPTSFTSR